MSKLKSSMSLLLLKMLSSMLTATEIPYQLRPFTTIKLHPPRLQLHLHLHLLRRHHLLLNRNRNRNRTLPLLPLRTLSPSQNNRASQRATPPLKTPFRLGLASSRACHTLHTTGTTLANRLSKLPAICPKSQATKLSASTVPTVTRSRMSLLRPRIAV